MHLALKWRRMLSKPEILVFGFDWGLAGDLAYLGHAGAWSFEELALGRLSSCQESRSLVQPRLKTLVWGEAPRRP